MTPIIGDLINSTVGKVVGKLVDKFLPASMSEQEKAAIQIEMMKLASEETQAAVRDMESARARESAIVTSSEAPLLVKLVPSILALGTVSLGFILFYYAMSGDIKSEQKDIIIYALGFVSAAVMMILGYYFGSSEGSKRKMDELMKKIEK